MAPSPGPWKWAAARYVKGYRVLRDAGGAEVITAEQDGDGVAVSDADAALIAAAPRMLELLRRAVDACERDQDLWALPESVRDDLGALLDELKKAGV